MLQPYEQVMSDGFHRQRENRSISPRLRALNHANMEEQGHLFETDDNESVMSAYPFWAGCLEAP